MLLLGSVIVVVTTGPLDEVAIDDAIVIYWEGLNLYSYWRGHAPKPKGMTRREKCMNR
jgi:hypothetical protein